MRKELCYRHTCNVLYMTVFYALCWVILSALVVFQIPIFQNTFPISVPLSTSLLTAPTSDAFLKRYTCGIVACVCSVKVVTHCTPYLIFLHVGNLVFFSWQTLLSFLSTCCSSWVERRRLEELSSRQGECH